MIGESRVSVPPLLSAVAGLLVVGCVVTPVLVPSMSLSSCWPGPGART